MKTTCVIDCASLNNVGQLQTYVGLYETSRKEIAALQAELRAAKGE